MSQTNSESNTSGLVSKSVTKSFGNRHVVKDVSLRVDRGQVVGLIGPNGAGKSTYFSMLSGIISIESGEVVLDGESVTGLATHHRARKGLSLLPQDTSVFRGLSVIDNLRAAAELNQGGETSQEKNERIEELLTQFDLKKIEKLQARLLSGGEKRRLELARLMVNFPKYVLLDEPFAGVDPISIAEIKRLISSLTRENMGVLITDHNALDTLDICDNVFVMHKGAIIFEGKPKEVVANEKVQSVYLGN